MSLYPKRRTYSRIEKPEPLAVAVYNGGSFMGRRIVETIPVAASFRYVGPDTFLGSFICSTCGFHNTYEGDSCSCRRKRLEPAPDPEPCDCYECDECAEHYPDCRNCDENERVEGRPVCRDCWEEYYGEPYGSEEAVS